MVFCIWIDIDKIWVEIAMSDFEQIFKSYGPLTRFRISSPLNILGMNGCNWTKFGICIN